MGSSYTSPKASFSGPVAFAYTPLLSDGDDIVSRSGTIASGLGLFQRGTILKVDPATGICTVPVAAADCNCILADTADATSATQNVLLYMAGKVKADALIWPGALGHGLCADALRNYGILVESVVFTDGTLVKSFATEQQEAAGRAVVEKNREELAAKTAAPGTPAAAAAPEVKPVVDSPWAYLTPEERANNPELATMPTAKEVGDAVGGEGGGPMPDVPAVTISPTSQTVLASGGSGTISVTITAPGTSGTWTAEPEASATWLTFSPTTPQSANGTVSFTAAYNPTGQARAGHCYINGKTFTCNQGAV